MGSPDVFSNDFSVVPSTSFLVKRADEIVKEFLFVDRTDYLFGITQTIRN